MLQIIIPHLKGPWLKMCVTAVRAFTKDYVITVVNNGSDSLKWFEEEERAHRITLGVSSLATVVNHDNSSFSSSINAGILAGRILSPSHICFLNDDVIVQENWATLMRAELTDIHVGMVGARTNAAAGWQGDGDAATTLSTYGVGAADGKGLSAPYLIFCCVMSRAATIEQIGFLDDDACPGWGGGEDLDYSWRIAKEGYKLGISRAYVLHACSQTYQSTGKLAEKASLEKANLDRLVAKWGKEKVSAFTRPRPKIAIGIVSRTEMIHKDFVESLIRSLQYMAQHGWHVEIAWLTRTFVNIARESIVNHILKLDTESQPYEALIFVDDDQVFPPDAMARLLRADKDVIAPIVYGRVPPYNACIFKYVSPGDKPGEEGKDSLRDGYLNMNGIERRGLQRVDAVGFGMVVMKVKALHKLRKIVDKKKKNKGLFPFARYGEDLSFCQIANKNGVETWADTDLIIGHLGSPPVIDEAFKKKWEAAK